MFSYDKDQGYFTRIKYIAQNAKIGDIAGYIDNKVGYIRIAIDGKNYLSHRLAWLYIYGYMPLKDIDHIDGNKSNNAIENLREATKSENMENKKKAQKNNKSTGFLGVRKNNSSRSKDSYYATITKNNIEYYLGSFQTAEEASNAYILAKRQYHAFCTI